MASVSSCLMLEQKQNLLLLSYPHTYALTLRVSGHTNHSFAKRVFRSVENKSPPPKTLKPLSLGLSHPLPNSNPINGPHSHHQLYRKPGKISVHFTVDYATV